MAMDDKKYLAQGARKGTSPVRPAAKRHHADESYGGNPNRSIAVANGLSTRPSSGRSTVQTTLNFAPMSKGPSSSSSSSAKGASARASAPAYSSTKSTKQQPSNRVAPKAELQEMARYRLPYDGMTLVITRGSVVDFTGDAIVNAANESCVGGGGVDGAISRAGGETLFRDRRRLPVVGITDYGMKIRCQVGTAVVTGPNDYGALPHYVIHAVGPNFNYFERDIPLGVKLLKSAYSGALNIAASRNMEKIGLSLLSAGVFRGPLSLPYLLSMSIEAIRDWSKTMKNRSNNNNTTAATTTTTTKNTNMNGNGSGRVSIKEIHLCAFTSNECHELQDACEHLLPVLHTTPIY